MCIRDSFISEGPPLAAELKEQGRALAVVGETYLYALMPAGAEADAFAEACKPHCDKFNANAKGVTFKVGAGKKAKKEKVTGVLEVRSFAVKDRDGLLTALAGLGFLE